MNSQRTIKRTILEAICVLIASVIVANIIAIAVSIPVLGGEPLDSTPGLIIQLFAFGGAALTVIVFWRSLKKRPLKQIGLTKPSKKSIFATLLLTLGLLTAFLVVYAGISNGNIQGGDVQLWLAALLLLGFIVQGFSEELLFRGYIQHTLASRLSVTKAIVITSLLFAFLHVPNMLGVGLDGSLIVIGIINTLLFSGIAGIITVKTGTVWPAAIIHILWNFWLIGVMGSGLSGTPSDGISLVSITDTGNAAAALTGGAYGLEASIVSTVLLLGTFVALLAIRRRR